MAWGIWLTLLGIFLITCPNNLIAISGLPIAVVGIVVAWPAVKHRKRIVESISEPQHATNRKKSGILTIIGTVGMTVLFLVLSHRVPREHLSVYLICVLGMLCVSIVAGLVMWRPWKS